DGRLVAALVLRGGAYVRLGKYAEALADLTRALELDPHHVRAHHVRAKAYAKRGDLQAALADLTQAVALDPDAASSYAYPAAVYQHQQLHAHALLDLAQACLLDRRYAGAYCAQSGLVHAARGEAEHAAADYTLALMLNPSNRQLKDQREEAVRSWKANRRAEP